MRHTYEPSFWNLLEFWHVYVKLIILLSWFTGWDNIYNYDITNYGWLGNHVLFTVTQPQRHFNFNNLISTCACINCVTQERNNST